MKLSSQHLQAKVCQSSAKLALSDKLKEDPQSYYQLLPNNSPRWGNYNPVYFENIYKNVPLVLKADQSPPSLCFHRHLGHFHLPLHPRHEGQAPPPPQAVLCLHPGPLAGGCCPHHPSDGSHQRWYSRKNWQQGSAFMLFIQCTFIVFRKIPRKLRVVRMLRLMKRRETRSVREALRRLATCYIGT